MRPSLSSADEYTAVHVWVQSSLPGCVCAKVMMSVVSVRRAAARRCRCVGAAACAPAASASGAASKAGCRGALSLSGGGLEREGCIQAMRLMRGLELLCPVRALAAPAVHAGPELLAWLPSAPRAS